MRRYDSDSLSMLWPIVCCIDSTPRHLACWLYQNCLIDLQIYLDGYGRTPIYRFTGMTQHELISLLYLTKLQLYRVISRYKPIISRENNDNCYRKKSYGVSCLSRTAARYRTSDICASLSSRGRSPRIESNLLLHTHGRMHARAATSSQDILPYDF